MAAPDTVAHVAGQHWIDYMTFAIPVTVVVVAILVEKIRLRRQERAEEQRRQPQRPRR